jgi:hypothetical protein
MNDLPKKCEFCSSSKIKVSSTYPSDWFCVDCKKGGLIKPEHISVAIKDSIKSSKMMELQKKGRAIRTTQVDPFTIIKKDSDGNVIDIITWDI